ncbi:MAG: 50S ribosomal protein L7/L12 [Candidatus Eisenbacteria sp.]|nr:50S ribosomal protein L7/L12 [Candidatus Eisenbacteria bacterium]
MSRDDILSWVRSASMIELSEVVKAIEEEFGVTASAPMALAGMMPAAGGAAEEAEQTEFDVVLTGHGQQKIQVIRVVREITSLGLKEAKGLVDAAPKPVKEAISREEADELKTRLEEVGATVEIK